MSSMSPSEPARKVAELKLLSGAISDGTTGNCGTTTYDIFEGINTIGGSSSDDVKLDGLPPTHALIEVSGGEHFIEAQKASSVRLNNCILRAKPRMYQILDGNIVTLGDVRLAYVVIKEKSSAQSTSGALSAEGLDWNVGNSLDVRQLAASLSGEETIPADFDDSAEILASPTLPLERVSPKPTTNVEPDDNACCESEDTADFLSDNKAMPGELDVVGDSQDVIVNARRRVCKNIALEGLDADELSLAADRRNDVRGPPGPEIRDNSPDILDDDVISDGVGKAVAASVEDRAESVHESDIDACPRPAGHEDVDMEETASETSQREFGTVVDVRQEGRTTGSPPAELYAKEVSEIGRAEVEVVDTKSREDTNKLAQGSFAVANVKKARVPTKGTSKNETLERCTPAKSEGDHVSQSSRKRPLGSQEAESESSEQLSPPPPITRKYGKKAARATSTIAKDGAKRRKVDRREERPGDGKLAGTQISQPASRSRTSSTDASLGAPRITTTGISANKISKTTKELGWTMVDSWRDCTHLVTDKVRRTVKFLCAISGGKPIVTTKWLDVCKKERRLVDPELFIVQDRDAEKQWNFSLKETLAKVREEGGKVFRGVKIYATPSTEPRNEIEELVEATGAEFLKNPPSKPQDNVVILGNVADDEECRKFLSAHFNVASNEYILQGILRHQRHLDPYRISFDDLKKPAEVGGRRKR